jgi:hypothetical protein
MKINYSLVWAMLLALPGFLWSQQASNYSFTVTSTSYSPLGASATAVPDLLADGGETDVPIGFNFEFEGISYDTVAVTSDGFISFQVGASSTAGNDLDNGSSARRPLIAPLWDDHDGRASSSVASYEVTGTAPNRIFTFEWRDWEWSWNASDSVVSFQVKLFETSNEIEFHYRWECASCITGPDASIGLSGANSFLSVSGVGTASPSVSSLSETSTLDTVVTDEVYRFVPPACPSPLFDSTSAITASSFDVYWSGTGSDDVVINWGPAGFSQATSTQQNFDTTASGMQAITGLMAGQLYDVYLKRECANGSSIWLGPISVRTTCANQSLPYTESFDADLGCFSVTVGGSTSDSWYWETDYNANNLDGNPGFAFADSDGAGSGVSMDEYLTSPVIDASGITGSLILEFEQYYNNLSCNADVEVYDGSTWQTVLAQSSDVGSWSSSDQQRIDISAYANANLQVRFHYYNANYAWYWAIDNFSVTEVQCNPSSNLALVAAYADSLTINWQAGSGNSFGIEYGPIGFSQGNGTLVTVTDTFFTANSLSTNTGYDFYVSDSCGAGSGSQWVGPFTAYTTCTSVALPYLEDFNTWALSCWDSTASTNFFWTPAGSSPDQYAEAAFWSNSSGTAVLSSRPISISQDAQVRLYWSHAYSATYPDDQFVVRVKAQNASAVWDTILNLKGSSFDDPTAGNTSAGSFIEEILILDPSVYTGQDIVVELHGISDWGPDLFVNDLHVEAVPPCPQVQNLRDSATMASESTLKWDDVSGNGSSYQVWFGPQGFYQGTQTMAGTQVIVGHDSLYVDTLTGVTCYEFLVRSICGPGDTSVWTGPYSFCTPPSCPAPTALQVGNNQLTQVDLNWTSGGATDFNISVGAPGFSPNAGTISNATSTTATVTGLTAGTAYEVYVRDSCGLGDVSAWTGPVRFVTAYGTNFVDDFNNSAFLNDGWQEADGELESSTSFTSTTSSSWTFDDYTNVSALGTSQKVNIFSSNQFEWLISPSIYLDPSITNLQAEFDAAVTDWNGTTQGYFGSDDTLALVISTDNGATWSAADVLWVQDASDTLDAAGEHIVISLSGYSGYVKFGFYAGSVINDPEDNDFFIDNFEVRTPRACVNPSGLAATNITTSSAVARWTPGDVNALGTEVILTTPGQSAANGTVYTATAADSLALSGLMASSNYCFYVIEQCANGFSDTIGPLCFSTQCVALTAPYFQNFDAAPATDPFDGIACWTVIGPGANDIELNDSPDFGVAAAPSAPNSVELNDGDFDNGDTAILVSPAFSDLSSGLNRIEFEVAFENVSEELFVGLLDNPFDPSTLRIVDTITTTTAGTYFSYSYDFDDPSLVGSAQNIALVHGTDIYEVYVDNFNYEAIPVSCAQPTGITLNAAACDTLEIDWTSNSGGSIIQYGPSGFAPGTGSFTGIVTAPYQISGLMLNTDYDVWIADTCGADTSAYAGPFTFTTDSVGPLVASFTAVINSVGATSADVAFDASASSNAISYSWNFDNGNTGSGQSTNETFTSDGTYNVSLTVTDRCGNTDDTTVAVVIQGISIEEDYWNSQLSIYPNPNQGSFLLDLPNTGSNFSMTITDLSGKVVHTQNDLSPDSQHQISLAPVAKGVYMVVLQSADARFTRRLLID